MDTAASTLEEVDKLITHFGDNYPPIDNNNKSEQQDDAENQNQKIPRLFSPPGLEEQFKDVRSVLLPCLTSTSSFSKDKVSSTASVVLIGDRGSGKSLLLERCLQACQYEYPDAAKFRRIHINGIVCRGSDVSAVVYEMIRQLSDLGFKEEEEALANDSVAVSPAAAMADKLEEETPSKRRKLNNNEDKDKYDLRLRKSNFTSNLALLETMLNIAAKDKIPVLLILDEFEAFTARDEKRQVLLYHLLDRVATPNSSLCLVGLTSSFTVLQSLEKRIKSRAEGVTQVVFVQHPSTYEELTSVLKHKIGHRSNDTNINIGKAILPLLSKPTIVDDNNNNNNDKDKNDKKHNKLHSKLWSVLEHEFRIGKDVRWFCRVILAALSLYRHDVMMVTTSNDGAPPPNFGPNHLLEALAMLGVPVWSNEIGTSNKLDLFSIGEKAMDLRFQALLDLPQSQVALLLAARRILTREAHREQAVTAPLTIQRMLNEYSNSFRRGRSDSSMLPAARQLLHQGLLIPSNEHSGGAPLQYSISGKYKNLDPYSLIRLPLHFPIEIDRELGEALNMSLLDCSTALREWGRKIN
ncbi:unnamed protein product [Cylindrotheca closterium]|uniref:Orc1-like AAA ATPase domain-containing protein n=1 Tax=Cylindrotheca closterium TaxID=2856 RepID=A0AAD2CGQ7_9STRA|nr:unnamed protein product [Cylindrotheca closterium]